MSKTNVFGTRLLWSSIAQKALSRQLGLCRALAVTITVVIIAAVALVVLYELMSTENLTLTFAALAVVVTVIYGETDSAYRHHHPHQGCAVGPTVNSLTFVSSG
jgi:carbon starvation protein CstA